MILSVFLITNPAPLLITPMTCHMIATFNFFCSCFTIRTVFYSKSL